MLLRNGFQRNSSSLVGINWPIFLITPLSAVAEKRLFFSSWDFSLQEEGPRFRLRSWRVNAGREPP